MFTSATFYQICIGVLGAVSVRGECLFPPDVNGLVVIPKGFKSIPKNAFYECATLKKVVIPASVENIEWYAFQGTSVERVFFHKGSRLKGIGKGAFRRCYSLQRINFPASLEELGEYAFSFSGLKKIFFKKGIRIKVISDSAFAQCEELKKVTLPPSVKIIGDNAFKITYGESNLEQVIFKKGSKLKKIGKYAFRGSTNLDTINIPLGVEIYDYAFFASGCPEDSFIPGVTIVDCIV